MSVVILDRKANDSFKINKKAISAVTETLKKSATKSRSASVKKVTKRKVIHEGDSTTYTQLTFSYFSDIQNKYKHEISITTSNTATYLGRGKKHIIFSKKNPKNALILNDLASQISNYINKNWIK